MADKPHSKRSLDIVNTRQGARSKKRPDTDFSISIKDLTNMFMPLYQYSWKGYGHNNALFHTMKQMYLCDGATGTAAGNNDRAGDCNLLSCLPGRQVYAEFNALPLMGIRNLGSNYAQVNYDNLGNYNGYAMPFLELAERAFLNSNFFPNIAPAIAGSSNLYSQAMTSGTATAGVFSKLLAQAQVLPNSLEQSDQMLMTKLLDPEFDYEGGTQVHKFTNVTSLPIYIEVREFMPRVKLASNLIFDKFGENITTLKCAYSIPGLRDTLFADLKRQKNRTLGVNTTQFPDFMQEFDQLDDKAFKYNKFCKITNQRWVVGEPVRHRIDPGHTWTYTMVLPACRVKMSELYEFVQQKVETSAGTAVNTSQIESQFTDGIGVDGDAYSIAFTNYSPKFSKFISVRATGSTAYTQGPVDSGTSVLTQKNAMENGTFSYANPLRNTETIEGVTSGPYKIEINPYMTAKVRLGTHAVGLLHTVSEKHGMRVRPVCSAYKKEEYNWMPNATGTADITINDEMGQLDPTSDELQTVAMDT